MGRSGSRLPIVEKAQRVGGRTGRRELIERVLQRLQRGVGLAKIAAGLREANNCSPRVPLLVARASTGDGRERRFIVALGGERWARTSKGAASATALRGVEAFRCGIGGFAGAAR